ncbi:MAG: MaoC family dehydratase N-terminal domain-containing protein [Spirochaetes bacterium]|nr:MaoC family dehydratase N-terminal domain-containing protein [Spirochaetota bacterium]
MAIDKKFIGKTWPTIVYEVGKEKVKEFAKAIKSTNPYFLDDEFAATSKYKTIVAPPTFAVVFGAKLIEPIFFDNELNLNLAMLVHGEQEFEFYNVVKSGDVLYSDAKIVNIENKEKLDVIAIEIMTRNQSNQDVCKGIYTFVVRK